jgi:hypothetical protein
MTRCSNDFLSQSSLAASGQQAEIRDIHTELDSRLGEMAVRLDKGLGKMNAGVEEIKVAMKCKVPERYLLS